MNQQLTSNPKIHLPKAGRTIRHIPKASVQETDFHSQPRRHNLCRSMDADCMDAVCGHVGWGLASVASLYFFSDVFPHTFGLIYLRSLGTTLNHF